MAAFVGPVVIHEVVVSPLGPAPRGLVALAGKGTHGSRDRDVGVVVKAQLIFPVQASRRDRRIRQPLERDVVEDVVSCEGARGYGDGLRGRFGVGPAGSARQAAGQPAGYEAGPAPGPGCRLGRPGCRLGRLGLGLRAPGGQGGVVPHGLDRVPPAPGRRRVPGGVTRCDQQAGAIQRQALACIDRPGVVPGLKFWDKLVR